MDKYREEVQKLYERENAEGGGWSAQDKLNALWRTRNIILAILGIWFLAAFSALIFYPANSETAHSNFSQAPSWKSILITFRLGVLIAPLIAGAVVWWTNRKEIGLIYYSYPTALQYKNHHCPDIDGIKCYKCGSREIWSYNQDFGLLDCNLHQCHQCYTWLYRT